MSYVERDDLIKALRRIEGQSRGVQSMLMDGRPCAEVVQQMSAMRAAMDRLSHRMVASNLRACLAGAELPEQVERELEHGLLALAGLRS